MPVNPLISDKIQQDDLPDKIKEILNEILEAEVNMDLQNAKKDYKTNIAKILERYADDEQVRNFCEKYE